MTERRPVRLTSLDEAFDASMKALLGGTRLEIPPASPSQSDAVLAYLRETYGLVPLEGGTPRAVERTGGLGGWLRALARRLFVSRTYHATLVTLLADVARRQMELDQRLAALSSAQSDANERASRVVFQLWGDYNHLARVVLDHHLNEVFRAFEKHFEAFRGHFDAFREHFESQDRTVRELTESVRRLEEAVNQMRVPHEELVRSVAELLAARSREEALARRVEALESARPDSSG